MIGKLFFSQVFPFTSESKRMGIIVKNNETEEIVLYIKGADAGMATKVNYNDWMDEECSNLAQKGLRTLVVAKKVLTQDQYNRCVRSPVKLLCDVYIFR